MKSKFSTKWKASSQPRKQRKFRANAPLHVKRNFLSVNLSRELRKKHERRNIVVRKGDKVKIMRGKFRGKEGKVTQVITKYSRILIEGIQVKKMDGSKANVRIQPSNVQIIELNLEDKKRLGKKIKNKEISRANKSASAEGASVIGTQKNGVGERLREKKFLKANLKNPSEVGSLGASEVSKKETPKKEKSDKVKEEKK